MPSCDSFLRAIDVDPVTKITFMFEPTVCFKYKLLACVVNGSGMLEDFEIYFDYGD